MSMDNTPSLDALGRFIRERRSSLRLTQAQLGERLGWAQERISVLENGKYGLPSVPALIHLANGLDIPFSELLAAAGYPEAVTFRGHGEEVTSLAALGYALQQLLAIDARSVEDALNRSSDLLVRAMGADKIDAFLFSEATDSLVAIGTSNTEMGRRQHELGLDREPLANGGRTVEVYQSGTPYYTPHADQDPGMVPGVVNRLGVRSYLAVPLRPDGEVTGVLAAASSEPDRFSDDERQFFAAVARWVALIARRAELTAELTRVAVADAQRLAAEEMVTVLAHDLGNVLSPIKGRLDVVRRRLVRDDRTDDLDDIELASRSVHRLERMAGELLDVARIEKGLFSLSIEMVDLVGLVDEVVAEYRPMRESITVRLPERLRIQADPIRIAQVLNNLLTNAVTHTSPTVPIQVRVGTEDQDGRRWAVVHVHDQGPGIPGAAVEGLFGRFVSGSRSSGLGMGLYLARQIAEAHGGALTAQSAPGRGTSFRLELPLE
jgi:two-component system, OmpR family, sensor kinase